MIFRRKKANAHKCCGKHKNCSNSVTILSECPDHQKVLIRNNPDLKTVELGIHSGSSLEVLKNHPGDSNLIISVHGDRYIIPRNIAQNIQVKAC